MNNFLLDPFHTYETNRVLSGTGRSPPACRKSCSILVEGRLISTWVKVEPCAGFLRPLHQFPTHLVA